jgi:hypothetical protein
VRKEENNWAAGARNVRLAEIKSLLPGRPAFQWAASKVQPKVIFTALLQIKVATNTNTNEEWAAQ